MNIRNCREFVLSCFTVAFLSGCGSFRQGVDSIGKWTADPITVTYANEVDLLSLLEQSASATPVDPTAYGNRLEQALTNAEEWNASKYKAKRREILEALRRKSNLLCESYKLDLVRRQARGNFLLGSASLLFGTVGAIATHVEAARVLAGAAALATGARSELNQDYYSEKTAAVLAKAIDKGREVQWKLISLNLDVAPSVYSLRGAIIDVEAYHATCSLIGALKEIERAVDNINVVQSVEAAASAAAAYQRIRSLLPVQPAESAASAVK